MANFAIAIAIVFVASVAHGQKLATREELAVSIIHPLQLLQGWLRAELDSRLPGNDYVGHLSVQWQTFEEYGRMSNQTKVAMEKDTDFIDPAKGRRLFDNWYNITAKVGDGYAFCFEQSNLAKAIMAKETKKINELQEKLQELREELESCIENSGVVGFFKSIFCTLKLSICIPLNTVGVPCMPVHVYLLDRKIQVWENLQALPCPPSILESVEYRELSDAEDVITDAVKEN